ncbi:hypothetical protein CVT24_012644 [Panaeolus cyanescens]|uniref:Uncharacterized protein n=1 Tax=Panaeolus cyanescens TaxID=181874 RepID=A0A409W2E0_9AGAR|nr:hypothetical protein CVT24_012644 [Panaeolus cyanescens]
MQNYSPSDDISPLQGFHCALASAKDNGANTSPLYSHAETAVETSHSATSDVDETILEEIRLPYHWAIGEAGPSSLKSPFPVQLERSEMRNTGTYLMKRKYGSGAGAGTPAKSEDYMSLDRVSNIPPRSIVEGGIRKVKKLPKSLPGNDGN